MKQFNAHVATGTATGVSNDSVSGNSVFLGKNAGQKVTDLSAVLTVTAATASITLTPNWQVSNDDTTFYDIANAPDVPAALPIATGTSAELSKVVPAPAAVHAYQFARCQLTVGGATGTASDLYSIGYSYRVPRGQARRN